jgi:hypothetical protein
MAKIENFKYSIEEAFRECFYVVPDYQREYVWTDKEVQQLLDDINDQMDGGSTREYFIGTVLVSPGPQKNHYEVIDGQQRLTTFFLLLCALKHLFRGEPQVQVLNGLITTCAYQKLDLEVPDRLERLRNSQIIRNYVEFCCIGEWLAAFLQAAPHQA